MQLDHIDGGAAFDWGRASGDYARYRDIYPESYFDKIKSLGFCRQGCRVLDIGTGTGVLPRALHGSGASFAGADISENQIAEARKLSRGMAIDYYCSPAEELYFPPESFDAVTAAQCFTYFDQSTLFPMLHRILKPGGLLCITYLYWLPFEDETARRSEEIIRRHNPAWTGGVMVRAEGRVPDLADRWFDLEEKCAWAEAIPFTRETWDGRVRACRGVAASSLSGKAIAALEREHKAFTETLAEKFEILHYITFVVLRKKQEEQP